MGEGLPPSSPDDPLGVAPERLQVQRPIERGEDLVDAQALPPGDGVVDPEPGVHARQAAPLPVASSAAKLSKDGTGTRKVRRTYPTIPSNLSLVVSLAWSAEPVLEQVVGLELGECPGALSPDVPRYLRHRQPGVVVEDALGHPAQRRRSSWSKVSSPRGRP